MTSHCKLFSFLLLFALFSCGGPEDCQLQTNHILSNLNQGLPTQTYALNGNDYTRIDDFYAQRLHLATINESLENKGIYATRYVRNLNWNDSLITVSLVRDVNLDSIIIKEFNIDETNLTILDFDKFGDLNFTITEDCKLDHSVFVVASFDDDFNIEYHFLIDANRNDEQEAIDKFVNDSNNQNMKDTICLFKFSLFSE